MKETRVDYRGQSGAARNESGGAESYGVPASYVGVGGEKANAVDGGR